MESLRVSIPRSCRRPVAETPFLFLTNGPGFLTEQFGASMGVLVLFGSLLVFVLLVVVLFWVFVSSYEG